MRRAGEGATGPGRFRLTFLVDDVPGSDSHLKFVVTAVSRGALVRLFGVKVNDTFTSLADRDDLAVYSTIKTLHEGDYHAYEEAVFDRAGGQVDLRDLTEEDRRVGLAVQHLARRGSNLTLGEDSGGDLVEQRLEQVVRRARDEGDLDVGPLEFLRAEQPAEAGADDDDAVARLAVLG